ncbi:MAG TPA: transglutaminase-like domain-containing protein [Planctomycetaceae bacterium]|nr:transglutaminase-like domain-containing protein [Planctomycetaceae bacterium]
MDFIEDFAADAEFQKLLGRQEDSVNLAAAALELARDAYPELPFEPVFRWIDDRAAELRGPVALASSDELLLGELSECLAGRHGIVGTREIFETADGSFLNRVIEQKTGIPISLSVLYMAVAERTGVPLSGVAAPGHFLTRYETFDSPLFVDAFGGGKILAYGDCVSLLEKTQGVDREQARAALEPVGPRLIIIRMLNNLKTLYAKQRDWQSCWKVQHRLLALHPATYGERRDWAVISVQAGRAGPALEMIDSCLATCPPEEKTFLEKQRTEALGKLAKWN